VLLGEKSRLGHVHGAKVFAALELRIENHRFTALKQPAFLHPSSVADRDA
jgi:hypothetical protein